MKPLLLDTGPFVAYLNRRDPAHHAVAATLESVAGPLHTTSAVITETMHFVSRAPSGPAMVAEFVSASGMRVHEFVRGAALHEAVALMARYADTPMDYADATLVLLAQRIAVLDILTLDRRGFATYRTEKQQALNMVLPPIR